MNDLDKVKIRLELQAVLRVIYKTRDPEANKWEADPVLALETIEPSLESIVEKLYV